MTNEDPSMDTFKRARELKSSALQNVAILQTATISSDERAFPTSSEGELITTLRTEGQSWAEITVQLNERRISNEEAPTWTEAAAYSRYILSSSEAAVPTKEVGFEPRDYAHLKHTGSWREGTSKVGKKRVKNFQNATELSANIRKPAILTDAIGKSVDSNADAIIKGKGKAKAKGKRKEKDEDRRKGAAEDELVKMDEGMVEILMHAVAKVERNFWVFVADEVEREAGKYVEPKGLERVFHDI